MKQVVWVVFDVLPRRQDGGLAAYYAQVVESLSDKYEFRLVSVFDYPSTDFDAFLGCEKLVLIPFRIDIKFTRAMSHLKRGKVVSFLRSIASGLIYFLSVPCVRLKTRALFSEGVVVASAPSAAIFISRHIRFLLEIHTQYEFFWGANAMGAAQVSLMSKPALTVFRTVTDEEKAVKKFEANHIYNCCSDLTSAASDPSDGDTKSHRVLFVGRLEPEKNPLALVTYAVRVRELVPDFHLDIYGSGSLFDEIQEAIWAADAASYVKLKGFTHDKTVYASYRLLWVSSVIEGFPLASIEAMSFGVPTVSSRWGDAAEEVIGSGAGVVCQSEEEFVSASVRLLLDDERWKKASARARARYCETFSVTAFNEAWAEMIDGFAEEA